jgi:hypothetical protein
VGESQKIYGKYYVRSISIVVDQGASPTGLNYKVRLFGAYVNEVPLTDHVRKVNEGHKTAEKSK